MLKLNYYSMRIVSLNKLEFKCILLCMYKMLLESRTKLYIFYWDFNFQNSTFFFQIREIQVHSKVVVTFEIFLAQFDCNYFHWELWFSIWASINWWMGNFCGRGSNMFIVCCLIATSKTHSPNQNRRKIKKQKTTKIIINTSSTCCDSFSPHRI